MTHSGALVSDDVISIIILLATTNPAEIVCTGNTVGLTPSVGQQLCSQPGQQRDSCSTTVEAIGSVLQSFGLAPMWADS